MLMYASVTTAKRFPFLKFLDMFHRGGLARNFHPELLVCEGVVSISRVKGRNYSL